MTIKKLTVEVERTPEGKYEFSGQIIETNDNGWTWSLNRKYDSAEDALKNGVRDILGTLAVDQRFR